MTALDVIHRQIVVSCQAPAGSPLRATHHMVAMARAAISGGAVAIRAEGLDDVAAIAALGVPVIGLIKRPEPESPVFITPNVEDVRALCGAGAWMVAADATGRPRRSGDSIADLVAAAHERGVLFMADVDSLEAGIAAARAGADVVASTLSGYTGHRASEAPDIDLVRSLVREVQIPVVAEGRYRTPQQVAAAFAAGAFSVVVGGAITDPVQITRSFVAALQGASEDETRIP